MYLPTRTQWTFLGLDEIDLWHVWVFMVVKKTQLRQDGRYFFYSHFIVTYKNTAWLTSTNTSIATAAPTAPYTGMRIIARTPPISNDITSMMSLKTTFPLLRSNGVSQKRKA